MGVEDDDLSDLERRMRAKLQTDEGVHSPHSLSVEEQRIARKLIGEGRQNAHSFTDEEQRMAERLVGITNAKRIASAKEGRRVRALPPPRVHYEWYWFEAGLTRFTQSWSWRINRVENSSLRQTHAEGISEDDLEAELSVLRGKGFGIVDANFEQNKRPARPARGGRKSFAERYGWDIAERMGRY